VYAHKTSRRTEDSTRINCVILKTHINCLTEDSYTGCAKQNVVPENLL